MPETPQSHYRVGSWTVTKLKDELRSRNLSPVGNKSELIERLERSHNTESVTPKRGRGRPAESKYQNSPAVVRSVSPSRQGSATSGTGMSTGQLKKALSALGFATDGERDQLMDRWREAHESAANPFVDLARSSSKSPSKRRLNSPRMSSKNARETAAAAAKSKDLSKIGLLSSPVRTTSLFLRFSYHLLADGLRHVRRSPLAWTASLSLLVLLFAINYTEGAHQVYLKPIQESALWYGRWFVLGVLSSVGLGTGAHTFLLFLGPFIARVTTTAYTCKTVAFSLSGDEHMACPSGRYQKVAVTLLMILDKVKWEAFAWGVGTAVGELPPYLISRASALAGKSSGEVREVEEIAAKPRHLRSWFETAQLVSFRAVSRLGFFGILMCASIPNPFFDFAGIVCGYFMIPFLTFAAATLLGKAVIKTSLQTLFVVFLFSKDHIEQTIAYVQKNSPVFGKTVHEWISAQRTVFQERLPIPILNRIANLWHSILILMVVYFCLSVVRSVAIVQAKREKRA